MLLRSGATGLPFLSRRNFLRAIGGAVGCYSLGQTAISEIQRNPPVFEEIPASLSGIIWTHNAAHSTQKYLPESTGPGCAFLDYDNDGWMDIYLVNSGQSETPTTARYLRSLECTLSRKKRFSMQNLTTHPDKSPRNGT